MTKVKTMKHFKIMQALLAVAVRDLDSISAELRVIGDNPTASKLEGVCGACMAVDALLSLEEKPDTDNGAAEEDPVRGKIYKGNATGITGKLKGRVPRNGKKTCLEPGCDKPRAIYNGKERTRCLEHQRALSLQYYRAHRSATKAATPGKHRRPVRKVPPPGEEATKALIAKARKNEANHFPAAEEV